MLGPQDVGYRSCCPDLLLPCPHVAFGLPSGAMLIAFGTFQRDTQKSEMPLGGAFHPCRAYLCCLGACGRIILLDCFLDPRGGFFQILEVHGGMEFDLRIKSEEPGLGNGWNL